MRRIDDKRWWDMVLAQPLPAADPWLAIALAWATRAADTEQQEPEVLYDGLLFLFGDEPKAPDAS